VSILVGLYVVFLAIGAFTLPVTSRLLGPRGALVLSALLVALGYALWLPFNDSTGQALVNMAVAGLGSGHWSPRCRPPPRPRRHRSAPPSPPA